MNFHDSLYPTTRTMSLCFLGVIVVVSLSVLGRSVLNVVSDSTDNIVPVWV